MGQKTNPISLRLNINRNFDSCWYQEKSFEYSKLLQQDLKIRQYLKSLFQFIGVQTGRISIQIFPKKLFIHYYYHEKVSTKMRPATRSASPGLISFNSSTSSNKLSSGQVSNQGLRQSPRLHDTDYATIIRAAKYKSNDQGAKLELIMPWTLSRLMGSEVYRPNNQNKASLSAAKTGKTPVIIETPSNISINNSKSSLYFLISQLIKRSLIKVGGLNEGSDLNGSLVPAMLARSQGEGPDGYAGPKETRSAQDREVKQIALSGVGSMNFSSENGTSLYLMEELKKRFFLRFFLTRFFSQFPTYSTGSTISNKLLKLQLESFLDKSCGGGAQGNLGNSLGGALPGQAKHLEAVLTKVLKSNTSFFPLKINSRYKSAQFLCEGICELLQQNVSFRQIYKQILLDIKKYEEIQGIRIVCSGRLGGVEMARVESKKYGQTSLHVFSSKIDFASHQAYTLYGLIGVKVWISFRF